MMFPMFIPKKVSHRTLFLFEHDTFYREDDMMAQQVSTYDEFVDFAFKSDAMIVVPDFFNFLYLHECIMSANAKVLCTKRGDVTSIRLNAGNRTRWIITPKSWGYEDDDIVEFLRELRSVYEHFGVGEKPTPSSLGYAMMSMSWQEHGLLRHTKPNGYCAEFIRNNMIGGRVDTPGLGGTYDVASLYDMSSAYASQFGTQPTGTSIGFRRGSHTAFREYFAECRIQIRQDLALGPFPMRLRNQNGRVVYPTIAGVYRAYLWRRQIEDAAMAGCIIDIERGFGWRETTNDPFFWCRDIFNKRIAAEREGDSRLAKYVKRCTVAAIGRHGASNTFYSIVPEDQASDRDLHLSYNGKSYAYFIKEEHDTRNGNMIHWYSNTLSACASELYNFALPYAQNDTLIATNYDAVITLETSNGRNFPVKYTADNIFCRPGTWLWCLLHNLYVKAPRTFISDEMTVTPGVPRSKR